VVAACAQFLIDNALSCYAPRRVTYSFHSYVARRI
jgi:hypothetical protein